ncbi:MULTISPECIES: hypothetical protein [unclassified Microcoleus]|uniref:hypothetical protein n=1 Tax=unclassified Microcoleus TaxID=2642155 RepID=UPI0025F8A96E|nr:MULTISPECIES: hypothetical protein [unclassified Microcoleus]
MPTFNSQLSTLNCPLPTANCPLDLLRKYFCDVVCINFCSPFSRFPVPPFPHSLFPVPDFCQKSTLNYKLPTVNCQLSTVNCQLSTYFLPTSR